MTAIGTGPGADRGAGTRSGPTGNVGSASAPGSDVESGLGAGTGAAAGSGMGPSPGSGLGADVGPGGSPGTGVGSRTVLTGKWPVSVDRPGLWARLVAGVGVQGGPVSEAFPDQVGAPDARRADRARRADDVRREVRARSASLAERARRRRAVLAARSLGRQRHPSGRAWRPDRLRLLQLLADRAGSQGASWPRVAAAMVVLRGIAGDDPVTFAGRLGIPLVALQRLEAGVAPSAEVPARLRAVGGLIDWAWVEAGARASPP
jgi:hypothetical protein